MIAATTVDPAMASRRTTIVPLLRWTSAAVILAAVAIRCLSSQIAQPVFDIDPMMALGVQAGLAPGWSLWLDALVIAAATAGLVGELAVGRRVSLALVLLAWAPLAPIAWHAADRVEHVWRGATWLSAMLGAVGLAHLCRDRVIRRTAIAVLLAVVAALAVRGAVQLAVEHPDTVRAFEATKTQFFAERGWTPGSPAARIYEERVRQAEASGWFGLANAYSTLMAAGVILAGGLAVAGWGRRERGTPSAPSASTTIAGGTIGWCAAIAVVCAGLLAINGSKGAVGALAIGIAVFGVAAAAIARSRRLPRWLPIVLAALVVLAVVARGVLLPEGFRNERSLLFRWHYLVDAAKVVVHHPILGVGPDGFQQAMIAVRSPRHPEEVASAHNAVADWWTSLGVLGLAWMVAAGALLARAVVVACSAPAQASATTVAPRRSSLSAQVAMLSVLAAGAIAIGLEASTLDPVLMVTRLVGVLAAVVTAHFVGNMLDTVDEDALLRAGLLGAICAVVAHAQIELTLWLHGGAAWCLALLGAAAPWTNELADSHDAAPIAGARLPRWQRSTARPIGGVIAALGAVGIAVMAVPAMASMRIERAMIATASPIAAVGHARLAATLPAAGPSTVWLDSLVASLRAAGVPKPTVESIARRSGAAQPAERAIGVRTLEEALREREDAARLAAMTELREIASGSSARNDARPALALGDLALRTGVTLDPAERLRLLERTREDVDAANQRFPNDLRLLRRRAELDEAVATITNQPEGWRRALASWQAASDRDPCAIPALERVATSAQRAGDASAAIVALRRALAIDEQLVLDPRKRLDERQRERIQREIAALELSAAP